MPSSFRREPEESMQDFKARMADRRKKRERKSEGWYVVALTGMVVILSILVLAVLFAIVGGAWWVVTGSPLFG